MFSKLGESEDLGLAEITTWLAPCALTAFLVKILCQATFRHTDVFGSLAARLLEWKFLSRREEGVTDESNGKRCIFPASLILESKNKFQQLTSL